MALIEFKNLPDTSTPLTAENLNNNFNELNKINSNRNVLVLNSISETSQTGIKNLGSATIPENGIYLICGYYNPNYYIQTGRELNMYIKRNNNTIFQQNCVVNGAYTLTQNIAVTAELNENDIITFEIYNTAEKPFAVHGGLIHFIKLK